MNKKEFRIVVDLFKLYYKQITGNGNFKLYMSDARAKTIYNFISDFKSITKSKILQKEFLEKFFDYQFNYWYKKDAKYGQGTSIQLEWIIGKKAIKRWVEQDKKHLDWIIRKNLKKDHKIIKQKENKDYLVTELNYADEKEKKRAHNSIKGFWNCLINTTMYNHKSELCMVCKKSMECKQLLKKKYPQIYKKRGYE
jgi:hypothetical protein